MRECAKKAHLRGYLVWGMCCALSTGSTNMLPVKTSGVCAISVHRAPSSKSAQSKTIIAPALPMRQELWQYLRTGLNYLETSGNKYPPEYRHPGNLAYGSLGLTENAVQDVRLRYKSMAGYSAKDVFSQEEVYEAFARLYADLLLRHYLAMQYESMPAPEVFSCLQKVWFLGPTLYKNGGEVVPSRQRKTQAFILRIGFPLNFQAQALVARLP